jgi:hypothetical protein
MTRLIRVLEHFIRINLMLMVLLKLKLGVINYTNIILTVIRQRRLFVSDDSEITISSTFQYPVQVSKSGVFKAGNSFRHGHNKDTSRYITSNPQWPTTCISTMSALIKLPDNIVEKDKLFVLSKSYVTILS